MLQPSKKILLIGASGGIGNVIANVLLENNYFVIGTYFQHPQNTENLTKYTKYENSFLDLRDINSIKMLSNKFGNDLYAIINCAEIIEFETDNLDNDIKIWNETIAVNLSGNYYLAKTFYKHLLKNGRFISISSTDAFFGGEITASYAVSKAGINSLTKSLSLFFQEKRIRVNSISPGWVEAPMTKINGKEFLSQTAQINPLKRNATPIDVANLVKFLLSDEADYINGQNILLEGGYTNQDPTLLIESNLKLSKVKSIMYKVKGGNEN